MALVAAPGPSLPFNWGLDCPTNYEEHFDIIDLTGDDWTAETDLGKHCADCRSLFAPPGPSLVS